MEYKCPKCGRVVGSNDPDDWRKLLICGICGTRLSGGNNRKDVWIK